MAFYEDLSPYNYSHYCEKELNVGWLQKGRPFSVGETPEGFLDKLKVYYSSNYTVHHYMGAHVCEFCVNFNNSSCEIRVVSTDGIVYATPELILHYIESHKYLPPQEFIDAVMNGPIPGSEEYENIIRRLPEFWEQRKPDPNDKDYEDKMRVIMIDNLSKEVDAKIAQDIINNNPEFKKFVEAYSQIMPAIYGLDKKK